MAVMAPLVLVGCVCLAHVYLIYSHNRAVDFDRFPSVTPLNTGQSLLIVSPHPDDETLGTAGMIMDALRRHVPVHVVFLTDGDGFRVGVARYYHELRLRPADYTHYGLMRENEARSALATLGLPAQDVTFLGYPDQGLLPIWRGHWSTGDPYMSGFSRVSSVPYQDALRPGAPYCGESIVIDLQTVIDQDRPTDIYTTHPSDDHPDHSAAPAFINAALEGMEARGESWAGGAKVHYFLVHRGDWPVPQGLNEDESLAPPAPMLSLDTTWRSLSMPKDDTRRKKTALFRYASQQQLMARFLTSFVRKNELFGQVPFAGQQIPIVDNGSIELDGSGREWPMDSPFIEDPLGDSVIRDFQAGADLRYVYICADDHYLYVRVDTAQPLSPEIRYNLYIRGFDQAQHTHDGGITVSFSPRNLGPGQATDLDHGVRAAYADNTIEYAIPMSNFGPRRPADLYIEAASLFSHVIVDRTGIRCGHFAAVPSPAPKIAPLS